MTDNRKYRIISASATLALMLLLVVWLWFTRLSYTPADGSEWPPQDSTAVLLADEYVEVEPLMPVGGGNDPDDGASAPAPDANDITDAGVAAEEPAPLLTTPAPSAVSVKPRPVTKPTGPTKEELEALERAKREKQASDEARNRVKFGKTPGATGSGDGSTGAGSGSSPSRGRYSGSGVGRMSGRGVSVNTDGINCQSPGKVTVKIWVDRRGRIVRQPEIVYPTTIDDISVRNQCKERARQARVTPKADADSLQWGTVVFTFK